MSLPKERFFRAVLVAARNDLGSLIESQAQSQAGATHDEARPENDKDTRATESSYLARGLAGRVVELRSDLGRLEAFALPRFREEDAIALGAIVTLEGEEGEVDKLFLLPALGGRRVEIEGHRMVTVTPKAPLGRALLGKHVGDEVEWRAAGRLLAKTVMDIA